MGRFSINICSLLGLLSCRMAWNREWRRAGSRRRRGATAPARSGVSRRTHVSGNEDKHCIWCSSPHLGTKEMYPTEFRERKSSIILCLVFPVGYIPQVWLSPTSRAVHAPEPLIVNNEFGQVVQVQPGLSPLIKHGFAALGTCA